MKGLLYPALVTLMVFMSSISASADGVKNISGEYTFYGDSHHSPAQCKQAALEGAMASALAREFGTAFSQTVTQQETFSSGSESTSFDALNISEVKGEWIADTREPEYEFLPPGPDGNLIVKCRVWGKARAISNESADFEALVLRNGTDRRNAGTGFKSGDDMFLRFRAPLDGCVVVYLLGSDHTVYRLLPYMDFNDGAVKVRHDKEYVFFSPADGVREHGTVDEMTLYTEDPMERNRIYVVFSPNEFNRPVDHFTSEGAPRSLPYREFTSWLQKARLADKKMGVKMINIDITQ
ncbi:MAG: DUF4384 domain-containing protein [Duncaniella sp.]|nr:DUF4384 domain-containing protein [Duncaniella sp.]